MPYIPHTDADVQAMLASIGEASIANLFDEIPKHLLCQLMNDLPEGLSEQETDQLLEGHANNINQLQCFVGAGAYEHYIPAAVWQIASRGEFLTAYTPYQAEASQGSLQLIYEYQTMIASLTGMEVANASLYDGASALAESVLMAVRCNKQSHSKRILIAGTLHPFYRDTVNTIVNNQAIECVDLAYCSEQGITILDALTRYQDQDICAIVIQQPNFFGCLEEVDALCNWAHQQGALVIACVNPVSLALLTAPGQWGEKGADIVCGEGQPLGVPLASGGPYFGFMTTRKTLLRQLPGRIVGRTVDAHGKAGFSLTLQAREQHIRRAKATSNICTNQGLLVTAATIYMSLLGPTGLKRIAAKSHENTQRLVTAICNIPGVERVFSHAYFHEAVIRLPVPVNTVLDRLAEQTIFAGYALGQHYPELSDCLLVCVTETKTQAQIDNYAKQLMTAIMQ